MQLALTSTTHFGGPSSIFSLLVATGRLLAGSCRTRTQPLCTWMPGKASTYILSRRMDSCGKQLRSRGQEDRMLSQPWGNSADQLAASTEQGLVASERQSAPAHLPDEDGEQGDRDTSAQATHERSKCQFWKPPVPPSWRPLYVDEGPRISLSGRGWRGDSLHRKLQGDCHIQMPWLRASMLQQSFGEVRWCCFITLIYPVLHP